MNKFGYLSIQLPTCVDDENVYPNNLAASTLNISFSKQKSRKNFCEGKY
jgi:hypothetical protein